MKTNRWICGSLCVAVLAAGAWTARAESAPEVRERFMERLGSGARALEAGNAIAAAQDLCWSASRGLNSHRAHFLCGVALTQARRPLDAARHLELASELNPKHLPTWIALGDARLAAGQIDPARAAYYGALERRTDYSPGYVGLGRLAVARGDEAAALENFRKALEANPAEVSAYLSRAGLRMEQGRHDAALEDLREAVRLRPDDGVVQRALAEVLLANGLAQEAIGAARRARALRPQDPLVAAQLARIYFELGARPEAEEEALKALALDPHLVDARLVLADVYGRSNRIGDALEVLEPPQPELLTQGELDRLDSARERWTTRREEIASLEARQASEAGEPLTPAERIELVEVLLDTGRADDAVASARALLERDDLPPESRRHLASLLMDAGHALEASRVLERLAAAPAAQGEDLLALAQALEHSGGTERARALYEELATRDAAEGLETRAHAGLARLAWWRGDPAEAIRHLEAYAAGVDLERERARARQVVERIRALLPGTGDAP